jgi:hypothetical protein
MTGVADVKRALYFGYTYGGGHFLHHSDTGRLSLCPEREVQGFPWNGGLLDTGLLNNRKVPDDPDGRVHWTCGGKPLWFAFFWWDRSGDSRGNSSSGFYVLGFEPNELTRETGWEAARAAFEFACDQWPDVVRRQKFPLVLV